MNRYEKENAVMKIDGYFLMIGSSTKPSVEFDKAKAECLLHLQRQMDSIKELSFEDFAKGKKQTKAWLGEQQ